MITSVVRLAGLPYFRGFYTKEVIVSLVLCKSLSLVLCFMGVVGMAVSLLYSLRLVLVFLGASVVGSTTSLNLKLFGSLVVGLVLCGVFRVVEGYVGMLYVGWLVDLSVVSGLEIFRFYIIMIFMACCFLGIKWVWLINIGFMVDLVVERIVA